MLENYEHAGKPLNTPIIRDILNVLEPWQESLPVSVFFEIITEYHLRKDGKPTQLKDFHTHTYDILCEMEEEGRAERYRDGGRDYWKLLPENSGDNETEAVTVPTMSDNTRNTFSFFGLEILKRSVLLVLYGEHKYGERRRLLRREIVGRLGIRKIPGSVNADLIGSILVHLLEEESVDCTGNNRWQITPEGVSVIEDSQ